MGPTAYLFAVAIIIIIIIIIIINVSYLSVYVYSGWLHPVARVTSNRNNEPSFATVYKRAFY
jgi:hypothetical protein